VRVLFRLLGRLPLRANHALGALLGRMVYLASPRFRLRTLENLGASGVCARDEVGRLAWRNAAELGKAATELGWALFRSGEVDKLVLSRTGWDAVERLREARRPVIFVIPHLGAYDIAGRWIWAQGVPILAMYRPHKLGWLDSVIREGRNAGAAPDGTNVAPATLAGVRMVLKHLRRGGSTVVLPDQVPGVGEGEWVEFFGRPAYTMTLLGRLQEASGAALVFCYAERLARGAGYAMRFLPLEGELPADRTAAARKVNEVVEALVRECPQQYLWGYNRYKRPAGAPPPP
jgi:KDO2-lipid IV(A) lauroyltransferase